MSSGRYQDADEVVRKGLRLVQRREDEEKARLKALGNAARVGIADIEAGRFSEFDSPAKLRDYLNKLSDEVSPQERRRSG